jgi:hypothetical protein
VVEEYWTGVPNIITIVKGTFQCALSKNGKTYYKKLSSYSKWSLRATLDKDIAEACSIPKLEHTAQENHLSQEAIYFADNEGNFAKEKASEYLQDIYNILETAHLLSIFIAEMVS